MDRKTIEKRMEDLVEKGRSILSNPTGKRLNEGLAAGWYSSTTMVLLEVFSNRDNLYYQMAMNYDKTFCVLPHFKKCLGVLEQALEDFRNNYDKKVRESIPATSLEGILK